MLRLGVPCSQVSRPVRLSKERSRNARSFFISGPIACARLASDSCSYQVQNLARTG
jgi:hypothetical protein